jgi:hypothetical protein
MMKINYCVHLNTMRDDIVQLRSELKKQTDTLFKKKLLLCGPASSSFFYITALLSAQPFYLNMIGGIGLYIDPPFYMSILQV